LLNSARTSELVSTDFSSNAPSNETRTAIAAEPVSALRLFELMFSSLGGMGLLRGGLFRKLQRKRLI
jgi:hypothetical protein